MHRYWRILLASVWAGLVVVFRSAYVEDHLPTNPVLHHVAGFSILVVLIMPLFLWAYRATQEPPR
jgi:hypothetical protein